MIIASPIRRIGELVSQDPVRLVPILDSLLPRKKGKKITNIATLSKPEILRLLNALEQACWTI